MSFLGFLLSADINCMKKTLKAKRLQFEDGFTLVELMIVVVIIGILAAIAIPIFSNQQKTSMEATLKADVKNAALVMQTEAAKNKGDYSSWVPSYDTQSENNQVILDQTKSNKDVYCLVGRSTKLPNLKYYFSSAEGRLSSVSSDCPDVSTIGGGTGVSFQAGRGTSLAAKKALIVSLGGPNMKSSIESYGYGIVDIKTNAEFQAMTQTEINEYGLLFLQYYAWGAGSDTKAKAQAYYDQGGKIVQDGNDSHSGSNPWIDTVQSMNSPASYDPTYAQGLNPSFPYTFGTSAWGGDTWMCALTLKSGAVSIATTVQNGKTCNTMFAASNGSGRWVFISFVTSQDGPFLSSLDWLNS